MSTNFSLVRDRFAEACRVRGMTQEAVFRSIGIGGRRVLDLQFAGLRTLDLYRVFQIADRLDVSVDWLVGRSDVMEVPKRQWKAGCLAFAGFSAGHDHALDVIEPRLSQVAAAGSAQLQCDEQR